MTNAMRSSALTAACAIAAILALNTGCYTTSLKVVDVKDARVDPCSVATGSSTTPATRMS